ncbi:exosortase family protein XrtF [Elizabethkingia sp. JS20170427COW]|uniref:exosortase family protein XrtF n=1 Tax=Elizabethkingia sp. JS20170427COW TaxID=2583851 RepID=UPI0021053152|nr:exosortase family protein XrtF [Elizabethkingia sp. JS20170427COW]
MKEYLPILKILGRFLFAYLVLLLGYQLYLNYFHSSHVVDPYTAWLAQNCSLVQNKMGYNTLLVPDETRDGIFFYVNKIWASIMVEGCNAVSVIILFIAFIFAFHKGFIKTSLFILLGVLLLNVLNISRIAFLNIVAVDAPKYFKPIHDYLFPSIIYGGIVVLWLIWIKFIVLKDEKNN